MLSARTRPLSRGRASNAGFRKSNARNGTQPEPRLRIILFIFSKLTIQLMRETVGKLSCFDALFSFASASFPNDSAENSSAGVNV